MVISGRSVTALLMTLVTCIAGAASAGVRTARPETAAAMLALAQGGDTIVLAPGVYTYLRLGERKFEPALTIDARKAIFSGVVFNDVSGIQIEGGTFRLPPPRVDERKGLTDFGVAARMVRMNRITLRNVTFEGPGTAADVPEPKFGQGYGLFIDQSSDVEVSGGAFSGLVSGVMLRKVRGFKVARNTFRSMRSDGVQVSESQGGSIEENNCKLTRIRDSEHPDCIQLWSFSTSQPTGDVVIRRNSAEGHTQGIGMFNHVRKGIDDGGFDRILIEENDMAVSYSHGIAMNAARDSIVRNNRVRTLPGAQHQAKINIQGDIKRCGNVVQPGAGRPGIKDKAC